MTAALGAVPMEVSALLVRLVDQQGALRLAGHEVKKPAFGRVFPVTFKAEVALQRRGNSLRQVCLAAGPGAGSLDSRDAVSREVSTDRLQR